MDHFKIGMAKTIASFHVSATKCYKILRNKNAGARKNHEEKCERVKREGSCTIFGGAVSLPHQAANASSYVRKSQGSMNRLRAGKIYYIYSEISQMENKTVLAELDQV